MLSFIKNIFQPRLLNAALAWQQLGNDAGSAYWLYAAPVNLVLQRDSFTLATPLPLPLEKAEIDALTGELNKHFAEGLMFYWHEKQWFLKLLSDPNIQTNPPENATNKDIDAFLPTGAGAMKWASFTNELQMLLFTHLVNQVREAKNLPAVNSIWCYGGGSLQTSKQK